MIACINRHMHTFRWGIIGPGSIAHDFAEDLQLVEGQRHEVKAVLGHKKESTEPFAAEFGIPDVYYHLEDFVKNAGVDAVYIATPHTLHHQQALACLNAGIPVLCEKPITINTEELESLVQAAQNRKVFLLEGMWIRFLPSIKQVLDIIATNQIGDILSVQANMSFKAPRDDNNRYFNPDLGGGSLLDLGVYPVFLASLLLGRPDTVKAIARLSSKGIDEACAVLFQYNSGQYAILESTLVAQTDLTATIYGSKGSIKILPNWNEKPEGIEIAMYNGDTTRIPLHWKGRGFQFEVAEAVHCIEQQLIFSPMMDHQFSLDMMKTMDTIKDQVHLKYKSDE